MRRQLGEEKKRKFKRENAARRLELPEGEPVSIDTPIDLEIDPADFFEFGYRRDLKLFRR